MSAPVEGLVREQHGAVLLLRLDRPEARNALTAAVINGIGAAVEDAEADPQIRALVLTGTGDRAFCSGMDLRAFAGGEKIGLDSGPGAAYARLAKGETDIPVIGAANGTAIGGGLELLLGSDIIVASSAAKFGLPEVKRGLFPAGGGTNIGTRIPRAAAMELTLTGDLISAQRGYELGLINQVVEPEDVQSAAMAFAERVAANAPLGLSAVKELVRLAQSDPARADERLGHWQSVVFTSDDAKEGAAAFIEKRAPVWQGR
ncbi:enoyl-CoA hydratase/crotonobetainyl-CoA hydratase [Rhodococcus sp. SMB37]|uniref:enoyl-CoA hydratase-related protein n=1 Tax=Rhodococcus sp. SMB37 TaxID=2512213 RepID=UPI0006D10947|nr:enoyl-CoA hydratase-related protein [Rhodococcus sp. SMB37]TCN50029.1 enoyl-CoA hydratase/crotonobetainyl-CoA hydratase [Rhodococcus sp. SMB37]